MVLSTDNNELSPTAAGEGGSQPSAPLLSVRDLRTWFDTPMGMVHSVDGVSFDLSRGELLGVVGESGSGKSVLCRSIMGLLPSVGVMRSGSVLFQGQELVGMDRAKLRDLWGDEMAMVFQDPSTSLNPVMRVESQMTDGLRRHRSLSKKEARDRALSLMQEVGIPDPVRQIRQYPHQFSGGMRQRLWIAIALSCEPALIFADEPTTALDVTIEAQVLDLLQTEQQERHMAMIMVTHNLGVLAGRADRVAVMYGGTILEIGTTRDLFVTPRSPYTAALLESVPRVTNPSHTRLSTIGGRPPRLVDPGPGCRFADRCPRVEERCRFEAPPLTSDGDGDGHAYACWNPVPVTLRRDERSSISTAGS
jgi:peptide/nickel transport system ATP-binding protein